MKTVIDIVIDNIILVISGIIGAGVAWSYWHYFQQSAFDILYIYIIVVLFFENRKLRTLLKKHDASQDQDTNRNGKFNS